MAREKKTLFDEMRAAMGETQPTPETTTTDPTPTPEQYTPDPGPTPARNVRINDALWDAAQKYARANGISAGAVVRMALAEYLRSH